MKMEKKENLNIISRSGAQPPSVLRSKVLLSKSNLHPPGLQEADRYLTNKQPQPVPQLE